MLYVKCIPVINNVEVQFMKAEMIYDVNVPIMSLSYCCCNLMLKTFSFLSRFHLRSPRSRMSSSSPRRSIRPAMAAQNVRHHRPTALWVSGLLWEHFHQRSFPVLPVFPICRRMMRTTWEQTRRVQKSHRFSHLCKIPPSQSWERRCPALGSGQVGLRRRF